MSTALGIASVTYVLKDLLNNGLIDNDLTGILSGNVSVSSLPLDRIDTSESNEASQLNLFMYLATFNEGWRNSNLPSIDSQGRRISNPPLAVNLHYLLTAYGADELHHEVLLGYGMQLLHETPVLSRSAIRTALHAPTNVGGSGLPPHLQALSTSELADQIEQIKIVPESLSTEELSKLWTSFQAKYRPTAAYQATVVLIESKKSTLQSLPVQSRNFYAIPFQQPVIEKIKSQSAADAPVIENQKILAGYRLVLEGYNLQSEEMLLDVDGVEVLPDANDVNSKRIAFQLPAGLSSGIHGVQVIHRLLMGSPPELHRGTESNVASFVLSPNITGSPAVTGLSGSPLKSGEIELTVNPAIQDSQRVKLLLNELPTGASQPESYSFLMPPLDPSTSVTDITIPFTNVKPGDYLVRIQVNGAESPLSKDSAGRYSSPQITIP